MVRVGALAVTLLAAIPVAAQQPTQNSELRLQPDETLLAVQGVGRAQYAPDMATLNIAVVSTGTTAKEATDANARSMADVIAAVRKAGIDSRNIRTRQISVEPRFARNSAADYQGQAQITGYVANNGVVVTVTQLDRAANVITAAFGAGANSVNGPNLSSSDLKAGAAAARAQAVANARQQAEEYASALGLRVVRVLRVVESGNQPNVNEVVYRPRVESAATSAPVATGDMSRTITVWIDFALSK